LTENTTNLTENTTNMTENKTNLTENTPNLTENTKNRLLYFQSDHKIIVVFFKYIIYIELGQ
jgi:hypothetical protein